MSAMRPCSFAPALLLAGLFSVHSISGAALSISPNSGSGSNQLFVLAVAGQPRSIAILIHSTQTSAHSCFARYDVSQNRVSLENDSGNGWASSGTLGANAVLGNNQCSIDLKRSAFASAPQFRLSLAIVFQPNFAGPKTIWAAMDLRDPRPGDWQTLGTWSAFAAIHPAAPEWTPIMTPSHPPQYFKYDGAAKSEVDAPANKQTLPYRFLEPASAATDPGLLSGVCPFPSSSPDAPPFWFDFTGNRLAGKFKSTMPSEYFVSPVRSQAGTGFKMRASFGGAASGTGVLYETAYYHQQRCDAGGMEFGFYRNVVAAQTVFYVSNNSNCGIEPSGYCHTADSYSSPYMNEDNYPGQALKSNVNGWAIQNLKIGGKPAQLADLDYSAVILPDLSAPKGYRFQVDILDPVTSKHADCDVYDTGGTVLFVNRPCGFPVRPGGWYSIDQIYKNPAAGYITVGIQRQGTPTVTDKIEFKVDQFNIPK
jgi:hypothetical protein